MGLESGIIEVKRDGSVLRVEGEWTYHDGTPQKEEQVGHNYVAPVYQPQARFVAGNARFETLAEESDFLATKSATITLQLANGELLTLEDAFVTRTGEGNTNSGLVPVRCVARLNPNAKKGM